jgi:hypothetical protein
LTHVEGRTQISRGHRPTKTAALAAGMRAEPRRPVSTPLREHPDPAILKLARALARQAAREDHARDVQG